MSVQAFWSSSRTKETNWTSLSSSGEDDRGAVWAGGPPGEPPPPTSAKKSFLKMKLSSSSTRKPPIPSFGRGPPPPPELPRSSSRSALGPPGVHRMRAPFPDSEILAGDLQPLPGDASLHTSCPDRLDSPDAAARRRPRHALGPPGPGP